MKAKETASATSLYLHGEEISALAGKVVFPHQILNLCPLCMTEEADNVACCIKYI